MALFSGIFKRKPGGTVIGNLLRRIGDQFTFGLYSAINPALPEATVSAYRPSIDEAPVHSYQ